jgi:hypothetical protein
MLEPTVKTGILGLVSLLIKPVTILWKSEKGRTAFHVWITVQSAGNLGFNTLLFSLVLMTRESSETIRHTPEMVKT